MQKDGARHRRAKKFSPSPGNGKTRAGRARVQRQNLLVFQTELFVEAADASASIHHLLFAGEEGVTLGANFYSDVFLSRSCLDHIATSTSDCGLLVLGMDAFLHECSPLYAVKK